MLNVKKAPKRSLGNQTLFAKILRSSANFSRNLEHECLLSFRAASKQPVEFFGCGGKI
jgi:hypothetical protein